MLGEAESRLGRGEPALDALTCAYRASLNDFATPEQLLGIDRAVHPATDLWMLAYLVALGALSLADSPRLSPLGRLRFAVELLEAEIREQKQERQHAT